MQEFQVQTPREGFIDITAEVAAAVSASRMKDGICQVFVPHTTAGVTINENADPDVVADMLKALNHMVPELNYQHGEGNSRAHVKSSLLGCSLTIPFADGKLVMGTWQGIYFCEFDGPRRRKYRVQVTGQ
ncbi:hypothetical protein P22_0670 [Propionispora sp. 2/2-37]|uniref:secondary thiamine-phosphate synthase enzyme YjbQ n=1 Tax=Propionispora sp. 2/2-37 TaxID=1677858 RepID=UPI0006BB67F3|nr:secondary thiamine-phosphate synthase enzyme YjbQ [Propionispora sp. 2/2-37]CUH94604.1 hypothetical protein P22_0670 [Propionispora sp. 2/2-37]